MCEFKIIRQNDGSQIQEDMVILSYNEENELIIKDVIGMGEVIPSALIMDVNTINQKCIILEHPIINSFIRFVTKLCDNKGVAADFDDLIGELEKLKISP
ncbi:MAG: hypothetical protein ACXADU_01595 [Promethearchaeota archaeon]|jgi:hypothetical protein